MKIISYFENYNHHRKQTIEPIDKPIKSNKSFKEVLEKAKNEICISRFKRT